MQNTQNVSSEFNDNILSATESFHNHIKSILSKLQIEERDHILSQAILSITEGKVFIEIYTKADGLESDLKCKPIDGMVKIQDIDEKSANGIMINNKISKVVDNINKHTDGFIIQYIHGKIVVSVRSNLVSGNFDGWTENQKVLLNKLRRIAVDDKINEYIQIIMETVKTMNLSISDPKNIWVRNHYLYEPYDSSLIQNGKIKYSDLIGIDKSYASDMLKKALEIINKQADGYKIKEVSGGKIYLFM